MHRKLLGAMHSYVHSYIDSQVYIEPREQLYKITVELVPADIDSGEAVWTLSGDVV